MRVLICGDRGWKDRSAMYNYFVANLGNIDAVIEGEARGADKMSRSIAESLGITVYPFPAKWTLYGKAAGPIRNKQMLVEGKPTLVVAFHKDISNSKGTADMLKQAKAAGIPTLLVD